MSAEIVYFTHKADHPTIGTIFVRYEAKKKRWAYRVPSDPSLKAWSPAIYEDAREAFEYAAVVATGSQDLFCPAFGVPL